MRTPRSLDLQLLFGSGRLQAIDELIFKTAMDPTTSHWLRRTLEDALRRDPLDALKDAEALVELLELRFEAVTAQARGSAPDKPALGRSSEGETGEPV